jgi:hypothetical protein
MDRKNGWKLGGCIGIQRLDENLEDFERVSRGEAEKRGLERISKEKFGKCKIVQE